MLKVTQEEFSRTIDKKFWHHVRKNSLLPQNTDVTKDDYLAELHDRLMKGAYFVDVPRGFIIQGKQNRVARVIPVLSLQDYCVYFYCLKELEPYLAVNRVENTFGGFSLGGALRSLEVEESESQPIEPPSAPSRAYNRFGWVSAWGDFQEKAWQCVKSSSATSILQFDIANFYDTIDLDLLETKVRHAVPNEHIKIVNLLFAFLRNWNRRIYGYGHQTKGLPQDEVGDCSRILANFFLQDYDQELSSYCDEVGIKYLRYADDQLLVSDSPKANLQALYHASILLHRQGLNINPSKVIEQDEKSYTTYWAFEIQDKLKNKKDKQAVKAGVELYFKWCADPAIGKESFRVHSVFKRIVTCGIDGLPLGLKQKVLSECFDDNFLLSTDAFHFKCIYAWLDDATKLEFKSGLLRLAQDCRFNSFVYELIDFDLEAKLFSEEELAVLKQRASDLAI